ncbi:hypothetical protein [Lacticaseibacillus paracasei]|uniref:hypothetical protein n=1 Tax=Lacticaseibacillus paracasei TaxID=1597 RepID=UPI0021D34DA8|nr:hypothetical protein [Lacticaseibacillus paracasei]MCU6431948.1 hypothetical protein [Lacticaseibacillus paracasei]
MKQKKTLIIAGSLVLVVLLVITIVKILGFKTSASREQQTTYVIQRLQHADDLAESGKVLANETRQLHNPSGRIDQVNVKDGDHVDKNAVLLKVNCNKKGHH